MPLNPASRQSYFLFSSINTILTIELINTSAGGSRFLLTGVERMALGANFYVNVLLSGAGYKLIATVADNLCLIIRWMASFMIFTSQFYFCGFQPQVHFTHQCLYDRQLTQYSIVLFVMQVHFPEIHDSKKSGVFLHFPQTPGYSWFWQTDPGSSPPTLLLSRNLWLFSQCPQPPSPLQ